MVGLKAPNRAGLPVGGDVVNLFSTGLTGYSRKCMSSRKQKK
jgi:hypothetical protein